MKTDAQTGLRKGSEGLHTAVPATIALHSTMDATGRVTANAAVEVKLGQSEGRGWPVHQSYASSLVTALYGLGARSCIGTEAARV